MRLVRTGSTVTASAPAKLNLFFELLNRRADGFHEVATLVSPINLTDSLISKERNDTSIVFDCKTGEVGRGNTGGKDLLEAGSAGEEWSDVPRGRENLVVRAVELLRERSGTERGATLTLVKRIPSQAGLGGGSSDAAAALASANLLWNLGWSRERLMDLGAELGSDVPLFFHEGPVLCTGRGEQIKPIDGLRDWHFVIAKPPVGLSTVDVYRASRVPPPEERRSHESLIQAMRCGNADAVGRELFNRLEEPAKGMSDWIDRTLDELIRQGCSAARMTGSGACCFGLCRNQRHAAIVARRMRALGLYQCQAVQTEH